jgi:hypothetical protein
MVISPEGNHAVNPESVQRYQLKILAAFVTAAGIMAWPASAATQALVDRAQPWPIPARIDVTKQAAPAPVPVQRDWTVGMWDFPRFETNALVSAPWRVPLLYESGPGGREVNGVRIYREDDPRVLDWHVYWMTKSGINLILWDWYPHKQPDGSLDCSEAINRPLEVAFLGKDQAGGAPVATNRFAKAIDFAVMVTDHGPVASPALFSYTIDNFLRQPNYYKIDGKPLVIFWDTKELAQELGGVAQARAFLDAFRAAARQAGFPDLFLITIVGNTGMPRESHILQTQAEGFDGGIGYHYSFAYGGDNSEQLDDHQVKRTYRYQDYASVVIPGHEKVWDLLANSFGRNYLLSITCNQDWRGGRPGGPVTLGTPADLTKLIEIGIQTVKERKLRPFVSLEAWNEFGEGAVVEPNVEQGYRWLDAIAAGLQKTGDPAAAANPK